MRKELKENNRSLGFSVLPLFGFMVSLAIHLFLIVGLPKSKPRNNFFPKNTVSTVEISIKKLPLRKNQTTLAKNSYIEPRKSISKNQNLRPES